MVYLHGSVRLGHVAGQRAKQRNAVLGRCYRVCRRRVHDQDASLRGGCQIHVVDTDTGASDHLQAPLAGKQNLTCHLNRTWRRLVRQYASSKQCIAQARALVAERTISASHSDTLAHRSACDMSKASTTVPYAFSISMPALPSFSATSTV